MKKQQKKGEQKPSNHEWEDISFCLSNQLDVGFEPKDPMYRTVDMHINIQDEIQVDLTKGAKISTLDSILKNLEENAKQMNREVLHLHRFINFI